MSKKKVINSKAIGEYEPVEKEFGNAMHKRYSYGWDVRLNNEDGYYTKDQDHAEIISRLVRIENMLKKRNKRGK